MPLSQEQITVFTQRARSAGANDQQIATAIARKQAQIAGQERATQAAQAGVITPEEAYKQGADVNALAQAKAQTKQAAKQPILDAVSNLLSRDTRGITGGIQIGDNWTNIPANIWDATGGQRYDQASKNFYDQLSASLSVDNREKLKGQGNISNYESEMLAKAASSLGRNLEDEDFRKVLSELQASLSGGSVPSSQNKIGRFTVEFE